MVPAYLFQAPTGIAGDITRTDETNVEPVMLIGVGSPLVYAQAFGIPLKYVTGGVQQFNGGAETAASFAGILVREVPSISGSNASDATFDGTVPNPLVPNGMAVRGYVSVKCAAGTPVRGGVVYVQIIADGGVPVGAFRADGADGGDAVALSATQAEWASDGMDANGNCEIRIAR